MLSSVERAPLGILQGVRGWVVLAVAPFILVGSRDLIHHMACGP
jgi:hypothetical protein